MLYAIKILDTTIQEHQKRINFLSGPEFETVSKEHEAFVQSEIDEQKEYICQLQIAIHALHYTETLKTKQP